MTRALLVMLAATILFAAASRRPAERLGLHARRRRTVRVVAWLVLGLSFALAIIAGRASLMLVEWVMAFGVFVPLVALALTFSSSRQG